MSTSISVFLQHIFDISAAIFICTHYRFSIPLLDARGLFCVSFSKFANGLGA